MSYAPIVWDPFAMKMVDRTLLNVDGTDVDLFNPVKDIWMRYARFAPQIDVSGIKPEKIWAVKFWPFKVRFVDCRTGKILREEAIDPDKFAWHRPTVTNAEIDAAIKKVRQ